MAEREPSGPLDVHVHSARLTLRLEEGSRLEVDWDPPGLQRLAAALEAVAVALFALLVLAAAVAVAVL